MGKYLTNTITGAVLVFMVGCIPGAAEVSPAGREKNTQAIIRVLDDFHDAAAKADETRYMDHLAANAVFLGTDAEERWSKKEFRKYVHRYFSRGRGWTYRGRDRMITVNTAGNVAWFSERLFNEKYGELRGSGVLGKIKGQWKISQYNMVFVVPNGVAGKVVDQIKNFQRSRQKAPSTQS